MQFTSSNLKLASFLPLAATVSATSGPATFYLPGGGTGACGNSIQNSDFSVALSSVNYDNGAHCGQDITVTFQGKSITVKVEDLCPGCASNGIDLTEGAFESLANKDIGVIDVTWSFD
ncbi:RlpA-like double-psi beta-barrel-protein domain-containing protein-containing protein [Mycena epipterygia]|nr:RlpA-like double-psi beta-barrel-protein domain-containing protein-containing protein [Mycena epipterygia]